MGVLRGIGMRKHHVETKDDFFLSVIPDRWSLRSVIGLMFPQLINWFSQQCCRWPLIFVLTAFLKSMIGTRLLGAKSSCSPRAASLPGIPEWRGAQAKQMTKLEVEREIRISFKIIIESVWWIFYGIYCLNIPLHITTERFTERTFGEGALLFYRHGRVILQSTRYDS